MGYARWPQDRDVLSANPRLGREAQGGFALEGKMVLVTFAETKVTRARGGTRIKNIIAAGDS